MTVNSGCAKPASDEGTVLIKSKVIFFIHKYFVQRQMYAIYNSDFSFKKNKFIDNKDVAIREKTKHTKLSV